jgi:hypothetical protein
LARALAVGLLGLIAALSGAVEQKSAASVIQSERIVAAVLSPTPGAEKPRPATARLAIARVRAHRDTAAEASPYSHQIRWTAEWRGDRWWVLGLFESEWGVRFVVDAAIVAGRVYTYINYSGRPSRAWVREKARRWGVRTLYTRFTPVPAIKFARESLDFELREYTVLDAAAKLAKDTAASVGWYFALHVQASDGRRLVLAVTGLGLAPAQEGKYTSGYGFGAQPRLHEAVPLILADWIGATAKARGWQTSGPTPPNPPPPSPSPPPPSPGPNCAASYPTVCIPPPPPDLDCDEIPYDDFTVRYDVPNPDPHEFDRDRDGIGCET